MNFLCIKEVKGKDLHYEASDSDEIIFKKGEKYEVVPRLVSIYQSIRNFIGIYAIGEDGKPYLILQDDLHYDATKFALDSFDFSPADELAEKIKD